jgi:hypothetical protein
MMDRILKLFWLASILFIGTAFYVGHFDGILLGCLGLACGGCAFFAGGLLFVIRSIFGGISILGDGVSRLISSPKTKELTHKLFEEQRLRKNLEIKLQHSEKEGQEYWDELRQLEQELTKTNAITENRKINTDIPHDATRN